MKFNFIVGIVAVFVLFASVTLQTYAAQTSNLLPLSDGTYLQWTPKTGTSHFAMVDEITCNGTTDYNSTSTIGARDSYGISLATVSNGATITQIDITPCASKKNSGGANSTMNVFYRLNGLNSADAGSYSLTGTTPVLLSTTSFSGLSITKSSSTTLETGAVFSAGNKGARLGQISAKIIYTPLLAPSNLTASAAGSTASLNWIDNAANEDGFRIERASVSGQFAEINTVGQNVTTYDDLNLLPGTYHYRVRAYNSGGSSNYTATASAIIQ